ncbi:MAG: HIT domain-containing protein [Acidobacteriota bacterium]
MDYLWSPWRYQYIAGIRTARKCVFCIDESPQDDEQNLIVFRGELNFLILNLFPYTSGHVLIAPYEHLADFSDCSPRQTQEMMDIAKRAQSALTETYHPDGFNLGMNLGKCAGAGVEHHLHLHLVPRWVGDSNFMGTIGETRVLPESLSDSYRKLKPFFS